MVADRIPPDFAPVIVEEFLDPTNGWVTTARIGFEVPPGIRVPLRTSEIERLVRDPLATYAQLENGEIWRLQWKTDEHEGLEFLIDDDGNERRGHDKVSLATSGDTRTHFPSAEEYIHGFRVGDTFEGSRITRVLIATTRTHTYDAAIAMTNGRYCDLRTRDRIARNTGMSAHYGQGPTVVDLGEHPDGRARYGVDVQTLDAPNRSTGDRIGLHGEFDLALVRTGGSYTGWHLVRPHNLDQLPLVVGQPLLLNRPDSPIVDLIYGVVSQARRHGYSPMGVRPVEAAAIPATTLAAIDRHLQATPAVAISR